MQIKDFEDDEAKILLDALDAWVDEPVKSHNINTVLTTMTEMFACKAGGGNPELVKKELETRFNQSMDEAHKAADYRREKAILIQAQIIKARDAQTIESLTKGV